MTFMTLGNITDVHYYFYVNVKFLRRRCNRFLWLLTEQVWYSVAGYWLPKRFLQSQNSLLS